MNERILEFAKQTGLCDADGDFFGGKIGQYDEFAQLIVYDFLSELTNDDSLGEARIATIKRLAEKWGVAK